MSATTTMTAPPEITADNVATLFPDVDTSLARDILPAANSNSVREGTELAGYDEEQVRLMEEVCIVLDNDDRPIGSASKRTCELFPYNRFQTLRRGGVVAGHARLSGTKLTMNLLNRPLDEQHRQEPPSSCLFRFPVRFQ